MAHRRRRRDEHPAEEPEHRRHARASGEEPGDRRRSDLTHAVSRQSQPEGGRASVGRHRLDDERHRQRLSEAEAVADEEREHGQHGGVARRGHEHDADC